jgi:hypothetical protein
MQARHKKDARNICSALHERADGLCSGFGVIR